MTVMQPMILAQRFTVEEFLAFYACRAGGERWQLIDGVPMITPPPTKAHQRIGSNLAFELNTHFKSHRSDLYAYQEVGLIVPDAERFRPEADVAVEESAADYESHSDKFFLVAEVLSDSNPDRDVEIKRRRYMQHPDNLYVLILDQKSVMVEVWARRRGWQQVILSALDDLLELPEFGISIRLRTIYAGTPVAGP
jgi:Uma2 family endonuclease